MSEKWWDMSDDELDDLFRDASDKVEIPFESSSFDKLRQKIDIQPEPEPSQGFKNRWLVLLAGLFLIVGVGVVYYSINKKQSLGMYSQGNSGQKNTKQPSNVHSSISSKTNLKEKIKQESNLVNPKSLPNNLVISSEKKEKITLLLPISPEIANETNLERPSISTNTKIKDAKIADSKISSVGNAEKRNQTKKEFIVPYSGKNDHIAANKSDLTTSLSPTEIGVINNQTKNESKLKTNNNSRDNVDNQIVVYGNSKNSKDKQGENNALNAIILDKNTPSIIENSIIIQDKMTIEETVDRTNFYGVNALKNKDYKSLLSEISLDLPPYIDTLTKVIKPPKLRHFGLRLALSPDINSIERLDYSTLGGSVGLLVEYRINKKFTLQTGISYSSKKYTGDFDYYHAWPDWTKGHPSKPTEVAGMCKIIDIPLNLRFNIFQKNRKTWFVSSGVSSYIMLNETYTYNYAWSPTKTNDWNDKSSFYWSTLNLSVGWEKQVSPHLSLQVEPYLKTPFKGVGRGLVNLYSSGILFSTKYEF